jgi:hypothetical protein
MSFLPILFCVLYVCICVLYSWQEGAKKSTGFIGTLLIILVLPFIGYWLVELLQNNKAKGCAWCGNIYNEAIYCGICGKNEAGEMRPGFVAKHKN